MNANAKKYRFAYSGDSVELPGGLTATVRTEYDQGMGAPWEEHDGHGPVSESLCHAFGMGSKPPKAPGERILCWDRGYYLTYDFAEACRIAKRDGWGLAPEAVEALARTLGRAPTKGEIRTAAVEADFDNLRGWANDEWHWIGVIVTLTDSDGNEIAEDSLWGIEDNTDYWREVADGMVDEMLEAHARETAERAHWEARDTITV